MKIKEIIFCVAVELGVLYLLYFIGGLYRDYTPWLPVIALAPLLLSAAVAYSVSEISDKKERVNHD